MRHFQLPECDVLSIDEGPITVKYEERSDRPDTSSGRRNMKAKKEMSEFRKYFEQDEIPLHIETKFGERIITWTVNLEQIDFCHFLPICISGLQETLEPYPTFAFHATMELLEWGVHDTRVLKSLPQVMQQIKSLLSTREKLIVHRALLLLQQLITCEGVAYVIRDYFRSFLPLCNILKDKHLGTGDGRTSSLVVETLEILEAYGHDDEHLLIQQYVPSYQSCWAD